MTATFFLVRHAVHGMIEKVLVGRSPQVHLSAEGRQQAEQLARQLAARGLSAIYASPRERAQETAQAIGSAANLSIDTADALDEIDLGAWTGLHFDEVSRDPTWETWNRARASACPPNGESMHSAQRRIVGFVDRVRVAYPNGRIAAVSHGDVIRAALLHYLDVSLDYFDRIEISPAGVSTIVLGDWGAKIIAMNERMAEGFP